MLKLKITARDRVNLESKEVKQTLSSGDVIHFTGAQRLELYGFMQDPDMRENILHNGFLSQGQKGDEDAIISGRGDSPAERYLNTAKLVREIIAEMSDKEIAIAQEMGQLMTGMGEQGNEVSREIDARDWFTKESYWPASGKVDRKEAGWAEEPEPGLTKKYGQVAKIVDNFGLTKERVPHKNPILIGNAFRSFENHVRDMSVFIAYAKLQRDVNAVLNNKRVATAIKKRWGSKLIPEMKRFYDYLTYQEGASDRWTGFQRAAAIVQRNFSVSVLGFRLSSIALNRVGGTMMNMTWLLNNRPEIAAAYAKRAANPFRVPFFLVTKKAREIEKDIMKRGFFIDRWQIDPTRVFSQSPSDERGIKAGANAIKEYGKQKWRQLQSFALSGMAWAEKRNVIEIVQAAEDNGLSREEAIDLAIEITRDTQNPSTPLEETIMYRDIKRTGFVGVFLPFLGQPAVIADFMGREYDKARHEAKTDKVKAARRLGVAILGVSITGLYAVLQRAIVRAASRGFTGDDDDTLLGVEREWVRMFQDALQELADIVVPGLGRSLDLPFAVFESTLSGKRSAFSKMQRPGSVFGRMSAALWQFSREVIEGLQTGDIDWHEIEQIGSSLNNSLGTSVGAPTGGLEQIARVGKGVLGLQPLGRAPKKGSKLDSIPKRKKRVRKTRTVRQRRSKPRVR